jgi:hypothetical protein
MVNFHHKLILVGKNVLKNAFNDKPAAIRSQK